MSRLWDRIGAAAGGPVLKSNSRLVEELLIRLEAGDPPGSFGLEPADYLAVVAYAALGAEGAEGPGLVRSAPRRPKLGAAMEEAALARVFPRADRPARLALAAGLLQVHDHWDGSHGAAQEADDLGEARFSAYWHGIAHRREPDPGNAAYWFRRVGRHPLFGPLGEAAAALPGAEGVRGRLLAGGRWDPLAFIEACRRPADEGLLRRLQRLEMAWLLDETASVVLG